MQKIDMDTEKLDAVVSAKLSVKQWRHVLRVLQADMQDDMTYDKVDCFVSLSDQFKNYLPGRATKSTGCGSARG